MNAYLSDRRRAPRRDLAVRMRIRILRSRVPAQAAESVNLSERGVYFATNLPLQEGTPVEVLLQMPAEITGKQPIEWRCTGHVVRVQPMRAQDALGIGVCFDCYEIVRLSDASRSPNPWERGGSGGIGTPSQQ